MVYELNGIPEDESSLFRTKFKKKNPSQQKKGEEFSFSKIYFSANAKFKLFILKKTLGFSDKIIAVTPGIKANLEKVYNIPGKKIVVVSNGANTSLFKPLKQETCKKELGLDAESSSLYTVPIPKMPFSNCWRWYHEK
jgi:glycosyltransferase involved in cell wall biosynthesis